MLVYIYACPLWVIILLMVIFVILWGFLGAKRFIRHRQIVNTVLAVGAAFAILYATVWNRPVGTYEAVLRPFAAFAAAEEQPELYREMLMNVFLFFPLGLTLSNALPRKLRLVMRIGVTTLAGFLLSVGIELTQYVCSVGMAETDDVICNTMGAFLGAMSLLVSLGFENIRKVFGGKSS